MSGFIYVVKSSDGRHKVGYSVDPRRRLTMLRTSSPEQLTLLGVVPGTMRDESELHRLLAPWRVAREWFVACRALQPLIDALSPLPVKPAIDGFDPAKTIIRKFGGPAAVAEIAGVHRTRPYKWLETGVIPFRHAPVLIEEAAKRGLDLSPADFLPRAA